MNVAPFEASQPVAETAEKTNPPDRTILHSFVIRNSAELTDLCHEAAKHRLFFGTPGSILTKLFENLHRYGGPPEEADFMQWASRFVCREAARYTITARILDEYEDLIHDAIHQSLWTSAVDLAVEHQDIFAEIVFLIFQRAHSLDRPGKAKLSTRLYALVKKHIGFYHNNKNHKRRMAVRRRSNEIGCEHLSEEELAAMKAAEAGNAAWDPGYAEAGLSTV